MQGLVGSGAIIHRLDEDLILLEGAVLDGVVNARELLEDDAAGADVEVADLGVAHLTVGQADVLAGSTEGGVRIVRIQAVDKGRVGRAHGVVGALGRQTEAVHDDEQCRKVAVSHGEFSPSKKNGPQRLSAAARLQDGYYSAAFTTISEKSAALRDAPPTRAPSTSGLATSSAMLPGLAEPP